MFSKVMYFKNWLKTMVSFYARLENKLTMVKEVKHTIFRFLPIANPRPFKTFLPRTKRKFILTVGWLFHLDRGVLVECSKEKIARVKLRKDCSLGNTGKLITLPMDNVIYKHVKKIGEWEREESDFLSELIKKCDNVVMIDIGANVGLVSLQVLNQCDNIKVELFEPIKDHYNCLIENLKEYQSFISANNYALGASSSMATFYREDSNSGNTSFDRDSIYAGSYKVESCEIKSANKTFEEKFKDKTKKIVIKSDTQGMDIEILSSLDAIWFEVIEGGVIELWSRENVREEELDLLLNKFKDLYSFGYKPEEIGLINKDDIKEFMMSKSLQSRNLYFRKNN
jgi:FkbM family methyltransferase